MLEDAGKDPIKRAELIGNLVQSISIIPEAIVRDVYIKECAQLLHVEDKLLVSEVAKRREKQAEQQAERAECERRSANAARATQKRGSMAVILQLPTPTHNKLAIRPNHCLRSPSETPPPFPPEEEYVSFIPQEGKEARSSINTNDLF